VPAQQRLRLEVEINRRRRVVHPYPQRQRDIAQHHPRRVRHIAQRGQRPALHDSDLQQVGCGLRVRVERRGQQHVALRLDRVRLPVD